MDDMMLYIEDPMDTTKKLLEQIVLIINKFSKFAGCKINIQNLFYFCTVIMNYQKEKLRK